MSSDPPPFDEDALYDQFPYSEAAGYGPEQGFNTWTQINDRSLFTDAALEIPAIRAFVEAPITVTYAQFKSSFRESEYFIHKPHRAMSGDVDGIDGAVADIKGTDPRTPIGTYVINHQETLAFHITRSVVITDGATAGQIIHKEPGS
jgi:hypothetical protein